MMNEKQFSLCLKILLLAPSTLYKCFEQITLLELSKKALQAEDASTLISEVKVVTNSFVGKDKMIKVNFIFDLNYKYFNQLVLI